MSEPSCGTDVLAMGTRAVAQADGSYVLTGQKMCGTFSLDDLGPRRRNIFLLQNHTV